MRERLKIRVPRPWPRLPDGGYLGVLGRAEAGLASWGRRRKRDGSHVRDAHVYLHVRLTHGEGPTRQAALDRYGQVYGEPPVCFYPARYEVGLDDEIPRMLGRSSKLFGLLRILRAPATDDEFDLLEFFASRAGWAVRVRLYASDNSRYRDEHGRPLPKAEAERFSIVQRILDATPPGRTDISNQGSVITDQGSEITHQPTLALHIGGQTQRKDEEIVAGAAVARHVPGRHPTALAGPAPPGSAPARADGTSDGGSLRRHPRVRQAVALFDGEVVPAPGDGR